MSLSTCDWLDTVSLLAPQHHCCFGHLAVVLGRVTGRLLVLNTMLPITAAVSYCMFRCSCRLLSRSDIFKPLFKEDYEEFLEKERVSSMAHVSYKVLSICPAVQGRTMSCPVLHL
jgi:hypothetical protein